MNVKVDVGIFIGVAMEITDIELHVGRLGRANIIVEKEVCKSNLF